MMAVLKKGTVPEGNNSVKTTDIINCRCVPHILLIFSITVKPL